MLRSDTASTTGAPGRRLLPAVCMLVMLVLLCCIALFGFAGCSAALLATHPRCRVMEGIQAAQFEALMAGVKGAPSSVWDYDAPPGPRSLTTGVAGTGYASDAFEFSLQRVCGSKLMRWSPALQAAVLKAVQRLPRVRLVLCQPLCVLVLLCILGQQMNNPRPALPLACRRASAAAASARTFCITPPARCASSLPCSRLVWGSKCWPTRRPAALWRQRQAPAGRVASDPQCSTAWHAR